MYRLITLITCILFVLSGCVTITIPNTFKSDKLGKDISGTLYTPDGEGKFPAAILMHGCSGITGGVRAGLQNHANFLVENGYAVLLLDSFSRRGLNGGVVCSSNQYLSKARYYRKLDAFNALQYLQSLPNIDSKNIFLMGQSNGAGAALHAAGNYEYPKIPKNLKFNAVVAFYPWCHAIPSELTAPVLVLIGEKDNWTPPDNCKYKNKTYNFNLPFKLVVYENAHHSFDLPIPLQTYYGHTVGSNRKATENSKKQMLEWFDRFKK